jgi:predicted GNAT superfamily acetyltransferase
MASAVNLRVIVNTTTPMDDIVVRECTSVEELDNCVQLQRDVFGLPDLEISPRRHLIVSRQAGGWTLGAFSGDRLVGFVHHLAGVRGGNEIVGYSHMMAVAFDYQNKGVGARLKWSQRARALEEGRSFIKWTWDPMQARNAYFNLNRLGVIVRSYAENFYGTDYPASPVPTSAGTLGIDSDRLFAEWKLRSRRVEKFAAGEPQGISTSPERAIAIPANWNSLTKADAGQARQELDRVRNEFLSAFAAGLICAGFDRSTVQPRYLLYEPQALID